MQTKSERVRTRVLAVAMSFLATFSSGALAASEVSECKAIEDDAKRLACYDSVSGRAITRAEKHLPEVVKDINNDVSGIGLAAFNRRDQSAPGTRPSSLAERWDLDGAPNPALFALRPYKPIYILPAFYTRSPNALPTSPNPSNTATTPQAFDSNEVKFQFSMKAKVLDNLLVDNGSLWLGYTQSSRWQIYNHERSRPFRETDYEPELIYTAPTHYSVAGLNGRLLGLSLTHQSNGRDLPLSRNWNRVIGQIGLDAGDWTVLVRPWWRLREKAKRDDNPDILNYVGRGELIVIRKVGNQQFALTARHSLRGGDNSHGSLALDWAFPLYGYLKGHVQLFTGYGESLIDYNHRQTSIGVGLSLLEWL